MMNINRLYGRWRILIDTGLIVAGLAVVKLLVDLVGVEFVSVTPLSTSVIAGGIFLVSLLLSGTLADYKESEKMPADIAGSLESIYEDGVSLHEANTGFDLPKLARLLHEVLRCLRSDLESDLETSNSRSTIQALSGLSGSFREMEALGVPPNYIVRLKQEQSNVRKIVLRIYHIQRTRFVPSAYTLLQSVVFLIILLLIVTKIDPLYDGVIVVAFVAFLFVYLIRLIQTIDTPFRPSEHTLDDVSLFLLRELDERISKQETSSVCT
jgi:hypothetical protein